MVIELSQPTESEVSALDKLKSVRRWSRADSATDPWAALNQAVSASRRGSRPAAAPTPPPSAGPPWGPRELAKAARLLERPALPVTFDDDHEMRRVYSLIYDVFRYKSILEEALVDVGFYGICYEALHHKNIAWLLLLDQQRRRSAKREISKSSFLAFEQNEGSLIAQRKFSSCSGASNSSAATLGDSVVYYPTSRHSSIIEESEEAMIKRSNIKSVNRAVKQLSQDVVDVVNKPRKNSLDIRKTHDVSLLDEEKNVSKSNAGVGTNSDIRRSLKDNSTAFCPGNNVEAKDNFISMRRRSSSKVGEAIARTAAKLNSSVVTLPESTTTLAEKSDLHISFGDLSRLDIQKIMVDVAGEIGPALKKFDESLFEHRVRISAAIAKIRIRHHALTLSELLPEHLRDERMTASLVREIISGWVNIFKSRNISDLLQRLNEMGFSYSSTRALEMNQFHLDTHCPKFISLRPPHRPTFISSSLISDSIIVLQEREFCLGAAALCRALRAAHLRGDVIQTHSASPRAAAYLASQLRDQGEEAGGLLVFGAGERKSEYENVLRSLGVNNARVFSESAGEAGGSVWAGAVAALAAPPNSYSAVLDPIDLVCSRGGDLGTLEVLTESEISMEGKLRVMKILDEQKRILRLCMSKPQIQMIVYETHSVLKAENDEMVKRAISEANRAVRELHATRKQKAREGMARAPKCATAGPAPSAASGPGPDTATQQSQQSADSDSSCNDDEEIDEVMANEMGRKRKDSEVTDRSGDESKSKKKHKPKQGKSHKSEKKSSDSESKSPRSRKKSPRSTDNSKSKDSPRQQKDTILKKVTKSAEDKGGKGRNVKILDEALSKGDQTDRTIDSTVSDLPTVDQIQSAPIDPDSEYKDVKVPDCDLFELAVPSPLAGMTIQEREGCYLALLQRKEMIRLNAKYMIKMAEARGLFGGNTPAPRRPATTRVKTTKEEKEMKVTRKLSPSQKMISFPKNPEMGLPSEVDKIIPPLKIRCRCVRRRRLRLKKLTVLVMAEIQERNVKRSKDLLNEQNEEYEKMRELYLMKLKRIQEKLKSHQYCKKCREKKENIDFIRTLQL